MATPRELSSYPAQFYALFREGAKRRVEVLTSSHADARRLRQRLYAFRRAIYDSMDDVPELALLAPIVSFKLNGKALIAEPKDRSL